MSEERIDIHLYIHVDPEPGDDRDQERVINAVNKLGEMIMAALDDLKAAVTKDTDAENSAITLLQGLKTKLDAAIAAGDPAALKALSDQLGTNTTALAAAVVANTPAA
jgi:hypothetical protein